MLPSVITGGLAIVLMFSLTHSAARRDDSSVPVLSWQTVTVAPPSAAPKSRVAHEARYPADEVLDFLIPLFELLEQLRGALAGIAANDCVHHCLLGTRRGDETLSNDPQGTRSEAIGERSPKRVSPLRLQPRRSLRRRCARCRQRGAA